MGDARSGVVGVGVAQFDSCGCDCSWSSGPRPFR